MSPKKRTDRVEKLPLVSSKRRRQVEKGQSSGPRNQTQVPNAKFAVKGIVAELTVDLEGFKKEERDEPIMMAMEVVSKFGLGEMLTTLPAYYYPRVVKLFYQQLRVWENEAGEKVFSVNIDGQSYDFTCQDFVNYTKAPLMRPDECQLAVPKLRTAKDVVKFWLGKVGSCVPKGQLPIYMQLVDVFFSGNVYPIGTHYEKRGVMLEELYKLHVGEWVDLNNLEMDYFEKFFENIIEKRLVRNSQPDLKFPRLTTQLLESKGYLVPGEEEKVEVKMCIGWKIGER